MSEQQPEAPAIPGVTRWRKRPIDVEAIQWDGSNFAAVKDFAGGAPGHGEVARGALPLWVGKSQALCHVQRGDWIIREPDGSGFYPCAGDVFAATYEPAADAQDHAGAVLTDGQCDRLHRAVAEHEEAASAIRVALDFAATQFRTASPGSYEGAGLVDAARAALKVLSGEEEAADSSGGGTTSGNTAVSFGGPAGHVACDTAIAGLRARAEAAEARLAEIAGECRDTIRYPECPEGEMLLALAILAITGDAEEAGNG